MTIKEYLTRKADNLGSSVCVLAGGLALGQFPQYLAQYLQRLGGHIDEAKIIYTGEKIPALAERIKTLESGLHQIQNAHSIEKLVAFITNADFQIARRALENYTPGITFNSEGVLFIGVGALTGYILYEGTKGAISLATKKKNRK